MRPDTGTVPAALAAGGGGSPARHPLPLPGSALVTGTAPPGQRSWLGPGLRLVALVAPLSVGISAPTLTLPAIAADVGAPPVGMAWLMTANGLGMVVGTPLMAELVRRRGSRAALLAGALLVLVGLAVTMAASALPYLTLGRAITGVGAGGLNVMAFHLAARVGSPKASGLVAVGTAAGGTTGLLIGAAVMDLLSWQAALALPGLALLALPVVAGLTEPREFVEASESAESPASAGSRRLARVREDGSREAGFDVVGAALFIVLVTSVVLALQVAVTFALVGVAAALALARWVPARPEGFVPVAVLANRSFLTATGAMFALATVNFALVYAAPQRLAAISGWTVVETGVAASAATFVGAMLSWGLVGEAGRLGVRRMIAVLAAASVTALGLAGFSPLIPLLLLGSAAGSFSAAAGQGVLVSTAVDGLPERHRPAAIGLFNLAFLLGVAVGPAVATLVYQTV